MPSHYLARIFQYIGGTGFTARLPMHGRKDRHPTALLTLTLLSVGLVSALGGCSLVGNGNAGAKARTAPTTPTPVAQGELARAVMLDIWGLGVKQVQTIYQPGSTSATVTITLGGSVPTTPVEISAANELTKSFCLMALQGLWTSGIPLSRTMVVVQGPIQDEYANIINQPYGAVTIEASQARQLDWKAITADAAWDAYGNENEFLRPSFEVVD